MVLLAQTRVATTRKPFMELPRTRDRDEVGVATGKPGTSTTGTGAGRPAPHVVVDDA